ncbi:MAG TPA: PqqD family protein [Chroococcales cyanobacterium]
MTGLPNDCPKARQDDILAHDVGNEVVIYDLKSDQAYCLNKVAAKVWKNCDGQTPLSEIATKLEEVGVPGEQVGVSCVLDQLAEARLIEGNGKNGAVTRREVLSRMGVAAAAVLASVTALNVPTAAAAQSGPTGL